MSNEIKERYGNIALVGNSDSCCMPSTSTSSNCCIGDSTMDIIDDISLLSSAKSIGYYTKELESISFIFRIGRRMWKSHKICSYQRRRYSCRFWIRGWNRCFFWLLTLSRKGEK